MKKLGVFLAGILSISSASAVPIAGGMTSGPDSSFSINFDFFNDASSTSDILSIVMDGSTATTFPILWDSVGTVTNPLGATSSVSGVDTQVVTFSFFDSPDGFNPGETFSLSTVDPDGVPSPASVTIGQMAGVQVTFGFEDGSSLLYSFADDPAPNAGLVLQPLAVPEPGSLVLLGMGLVGMGLSRRKTKA